MRRSIRKISIVLGWLLLWQLAAVCTDNHILLVGPLQVLGALGENIRQPDFWRIVGCSFARIGSGFGCALAAGLVLGACSYRYRLVEEILAPLMETLKSIPVASFVVLLLIWFGSSKLSFFISFLIVFPNVYVNTVEGLRSTDPRLLEMAAVFQMSAWNRLWYLYRPALMPYLTGCLKISLGMSWKSGVAAEVIGLPDYSLGERLYMSKIYLDTAGLFAWTLTVILLSFLFEKAVLFVLRYIGAWTPGQNDRRSRAGNRKAAEGLETIWGAGEITAEHLQKSYGENCVLRDLSFTLKAGGRYLLMAPSGAGKTTLLRILTGITKADEGSVQGLKGQQAGMVFQEDRLCEEYSAVTNIMIAIGRKNRKGSTLRQQIVQEAERILPADCLNKPVKELSGGMRRRVCLLRAVLSDAQLLVLDEPFNGLDEETRERCGRYLLERQAGRTILVTSHRMEDRELLNCELLEGFSVCAKNVRGNGD